MFVKLEISHHYLHYQKLFLILAVTVSNCIRKLPTRNQSARNLNFMTKFLVPGILLNTTSTHFGIVCVSSHPIQASTYTNLNTINVSENSLLGPDNYTSKSTIAKEEGIDAKLNVTSSIQIFETDPKLQEQSRTKVTPENMNSENVQNTIQDVEETDTFPSNSLQYPSVSFDNILDECREAKKCHVSRGIFYVCGNDNRTYQNLGVFICAQLCKINLKLKYFRQCDDAIPFGPKPPNILKSVRSTTPESLLNINLTEFKKDIKEEDKVNYTVVAVLKRRILDRQESNPMSPTEKKWCEDNPTECRYGHDPSYDPRLYLIPVKKYSDTQKWMKTHSKALKSQVDYLMYPIPTTLPKKTWF